MLELWPCGSRITETGGPFTLPPSSLVEMSGILVIRSGRQRWTGKVEPLKGAGRLHSSAAR